MILQTPFVGFNIKLKKFTNSNVWRVDLYQFYVCLGFYNEKNE